MGDALRIRPALVVALLLGTVVVGGLVAFLPALLERDALTSGTPVRRDGVAHDVVLEPGARACVAGVALDERSAVARIWVRDVPSTGTRLRATATAPGVRATGTAAMGPGPAESEPVTVDVPLTPTPARAVAGGTLCLVNEGDEPLAIVGTDHARAVVGSSGALDGTPIEQLPSLALLDDRERTLLARAPTLVDRAAALSPFGPWLFWLLVPLLVLGLPALVASALWRALSQDETEREGR